MPKQANDKMESFGKRLAELRKAAGFTQQQLADEIGASRRQIAYYETETGHPPASFLIDLARALNLTTDELLGLKATRRPAAPAKISPRLERRLRQIERLDPKPKQQILATLDTLLTAEAIKQQAGR